MEQQQRQQQGSAGQFPSLLRHLRGGDLFTTGSRTPDAPTQLEPDQERSQLTDSAVSQMREQLETIWRNLANARRTWGVESKQYGYIMEIGRTYLEENFEDPELREAIMRALMWTEAAEGGEDIMDLDLEHGKQRSSQRGQGEDDGVWERGPEKGVEESMKDLRI